MSRAYERTTFRGHVLNRRTAALVEHIEDVGDLRFHVIQGCFNNGAVTASAGTHDGSGAVDLMPLTANGKAPSKALLAKSVRIARLCGLWLWDRPELWIDGHREWTHHQHGIALGDRLLSEGAQKQVHDAYAGLTGLSGHAKATGMNAFMPTVIVPFRYPLAQVDLSNVVKEAKRGARAKHTALPGVRRVQTALNVKYGWQLPVDGIWGPKTKAAYARYEHAVGGDGDGIPAEFSLKLLGAALFQVQP